MSNSKQYSDTITKVRAILRIEQPVVIIEVANNAQNIVRSPKQFLMDLQDSHILPASVPATIESFSNPLVQDAMIDIQGGRVTGNIEFFKAGSEYTADENSSVIINPEHPLHGKVKIGQKVQREKDGSRVEGFLTLDRSFAAKQTRANAGALAAQMLQALGGPTGVAASTSTSSTEEVEEPAEATSKK